MVNSFMIKEPTMYNGECIVSSINGVGRTGQPHAKEGTGFLSYTIHKNLLKMN